MRTAILLISFVMAACAPQNGETNSAPSRPGAAVDTVAIRGAVSVVGSAPVSTAVVVRGANGESSRVAGPLAEEIGRLSGAEVEVVGIREPDAMHGQAIHATGYEVRSVDGRSVITGVVERGPDGQLQLRAEDGTVVRLSGGAQLRPGQKIWVQGPATVQVQSYGVIRP
jgi:hypothetical protein